MGSAQKIQKYDIIKGVKTGRLAGRPGDMGVKRDVLPRRSGAAEHGGIFPTVWRQTA